MSKDSRRQREVARVREDILQAAARAFARHGPKGTTIQEVAREAGYAPAALYSYFKGKDEIFSGILDGLTEKILATFEEAVPAGLTFAQRVDLLFHRQCRIVEAHRHAFLLFITARPEPGVAECAEASHGRGFHRYAVRLTRWIEAEAGEGDLTACSPAEAACAFIGIGYAFFRRWLQEGEEDERFSEQGPLIVRLFLHGVGAGASAVSDEMDT